MNNRGRRKRVGGLRQTWCDRHIGYQGYDNELQSDQRDGRRADDYVEVLPSCECCHLITNFVWVLAAGKRYLTLEMGLGPVPSLSKQSGDVPRCRTPKEAAIREYTDVHNENPKPLIWTKPADQILASIARFALRTCPSPPDVASA
jgi:hypothetical protein